MSDQVADLFNGKDLVPYHTTPNDVKFEKQIPSMKENDEFAETQNVMFTGKQMQLKLDTSDHIYQAYGKWRCPMHYRICLPFASPYKYLYGNDGFSCNDITIRGTKF